MKRFPKPCCCLILILFFSAFTLQAQQEDRIIGVSISGLKRTRLATAERYLEKFIGLEADTLDINEVWAAVLGTGILEPLSVQIDVLPSGEKILAVSVHEKWSIFPVPVLILSSEGVSAGGAVYDANAFGMNDKLFLAGFYYSEGWLAAAGYIHESPVLGVPGWNIMANFSRAERHDRDQRREDLRRFDLDGISFRAGLNFRLLDNSGPLSAQVHASYAQKILRNREEAVNGPEEGSRILGTGGGFSFEKSSWDGFLLSREEASLQYAFHVPLEGSFFQSYRFRGVLEKSLVPGFRLVAKTGLLFQPGVPVLFESPPSAAQVAILPLSFSAQNYAGLSAGLEKYLLKFSTGTLSVQASYQLVYSRSSVLGDSFDHGVAAMFSFYLSRLAIPAIGLGAAYNVKENFLQGSFSIGMTF